MIFTAAGVAAAVATAPALVATLRGDAIDRILGLQVVSADVALVFAVLAGESRTSFDLDLAIAVALLSFLGALGLLRFLGSVA